MDINAAFPSNYLKAADLGGQDAALVISHVAMEDIGGDVKPIVYFVGKERGLVLNKTNASTIADQHGGETDMWANKQITLFPSQTDFQGKQVACIRVRIGVAQQVPQPTVGGLPASDDIPF